MALVQVKYRRRSVTCGRSVVRFSRSLRFEPLEDRRLLSITVNILMDEADGSLLDGDVSLRDAINLAAPGDTINFSVTGAINLTLGQLAINKGLTIDGPGANLLQIDASGNDPTPNMNNGDGSRVFHIGDGDANSNLNVTLTSLTITGGDSAAGGGAIHNENEMVVLTASTVSGNAGMQGGGLFINPGGELTLIDSTISGNAAVEEGGGIYSNHGQVTLTRSVATDNSAGRDGGAVFACYGNLVVSDSTITGNATGGDGGGLYSSFGSFSVMRSTISGNEARYGGGIYNYSDATVTHSTIDGNSAVESGGGVYTRGSLTLSNSTISGNSAAVGGGILSYTDPLGPTTTVAGSTISGNTATELGGGFYNYFGVSVIRHTTITKNTAPIGGGGGVASYAGSNMRTEVHSTIIAGNNGSDVDFVSGAVNSLQSNAYNLIGAGNAVAAFNQPGDATGVADPMLGPLADNGGPTKTHAPGSPAINAGDPNAVAGVGDVPLHDQRGAPFTRVYDGRIDIGAFEIQPMPPAFFGDYNQDGTVDAADYVVWRKLLGSNVAKYGGADGSGDGTIDQGDFSVWRAHFGQTLPPLDMGFGVSIVTTSTALVTPDTTVSSEKTSVSLHRSEPKQAVEVLGTNKGQPARAKREPARIELVVPPALQLAHYRPAIRSSLRATAAAAANRHDYALLAWLGNASTNQKVKDWQEPHTWVDEEASSAGELQVDSVDEVFALLARG